MKAGRPDYDRFQDPAAHGEAEIYDFIGELADEIEKDGCGEGVLDVISGAAPPVAKLRAFAARADLPPGASAIGLDEPVFIIRARDLLGVEAVMAYYQLAIEHRRHPALIASALHQAREFVEWRRLNGSLVHDPDLPRSTPAEGGTS